MLILLSHINCTHIRCVVVYAVKKTRLEVCTMGNAARTCWISPYWARISGNTHCINSCTWSNTRRKCVMCRFNSHNNTAVFTVNASGFSFVSVITRILFIVIHAFSERKHSSGNFEEHYKSTNPSEDLRFTKKLEVQDVWISDRANVNGHCSAERMRLNGNIHGVWFFSLITLILCITTEAFSEKKNSCGYFNNIFKSINASEGLYFK